MVRLVSLSVLLTLIVILGLTFYKVVAPFILPLFLAAVFAILCQPLYTYFLKRTDNRIRLAAGLTSGTVVSVILVPLVVGTILASLQLFVVATNLKDRDFGRTLREKTDPLLQHVAKFVNARTSPQVTNPETPPEEEPDPPEDAGNEKAPSSDVAEPPIDEEGDIDAAVTPVPAETTDVPTEDPATDDPLVVENVVGDTAVTIPPVPIPQKLTAEDIRRQANTWLRHWLADVGSKSLGVAGGTLAGSVMAAGGTALAFVIFAVSLYYFLADGTQLVLATERLIPVHVEYQREMLAQFSKVVRAVVMATFFAALAQAIATVAALWILGFDHLFVIFIVALLTSMIPMMGTWLVWLPCAAYLLYNGHWFQALLLTVYGSAFVGMLDNVVRTYVLNTDVKLHPLLALISVLGGLQVMGLWGMFVGPIVASCLHALVKIFNVELLELSKETFSPLEGKEQPRPQEPSPPPTPTVAKQDVSGQNESSGA